MLKLPFLKYCCLLTALFSFNVAHSATFSSASNSSASRSEKAEVNRARIAFEKLKSLAGTWKATPTEHQMDTVTIEVIAGGSAVLERTGGMVTVFHMNGDVLMATHYCEAQNQPRFVAESIYDTNILQFRFLDITNAKPDEAYINSIRLEIVDHNQVVQSWTWLEKGMEQGLSFRLTRVNN